MYKKFYEGSHKKSESKAEFLKAGDTTPHIPLIFCGGARLLLLLNRPLKKLDRVGTVDKRPPTAKLQNYVKKTTTKKREK